jgi:hypothetical protein
VSYPFNHFGLARFLNCTNRVHSFTAVPFITSPVMAKVFFPCIAASQAVPLLDQAAGGRRRGRGKRGIQGILRGAMLLDNAGNNEERGGEAGEGREGKEESRERRATRGPPQEASTIIH